MAFRLQWSQEAIAQYDKLKHAALKAKDTRQKNKKKKSSRQEGLFKQVHKAISLLCDDPRHPGLKMHKYESIIDPSGQQRQIFEAYAQNNTPEAYRIFWHYGHGKGEISIVAITPHP